MNQLDERVALVTGGGRGLGRGIALELVRRGAKVMVNDVYRDDAGNSAADGVVAEIGATGGEGAANYDSVASFDAGARIVRSVVDRFGKIDILVNCAGNAAFSSVLDIEEPEWDAITAVHLTGHAACITAASAQMIGQSSPGRIITISSRGAFFSFGVAYAAAKAGIMGLTASASVELRPHGITVNCVLPSATTQLFPTDASTRTLGGMPASLDMDPECVAPTVAFLCSDAAQEVTGRYIYASGGDLTIYTHPLLLQDSNLFVRKMGRWHLEELEDALPPLLGVSLPPPGSR
jgi:NAD(P)-dependent dehydrogenase (short-subunit alcohol dehydrogenase family)